MSWLWELQYLTTFTVCSFVTRLAARTGSEQWEGGVHDVRLPE